MASVASRGIRYQVFVAKLPWTVCRDTLREHFQQFGKVVFSKVVFDYNTGRSRRYGFVDFDSPESQQKALAETNHIIDGSKVLVQAEHSATNNKQDQEINFTEL